VFPLVGGVGKTPPFPGIEHPFSSIFFGGSAAVGKTRKRKAAHFRAGGAGGGVSVRVCAKLASARQAIFRLLIPTILVAPRARFRYDAAALKWTPG
jgi:hypothetical protein